MSCEVDEIEECFNKAIEKYGDMVYRIAVNQMKNRSDADDIFQEVFIKWMQYREKFTSEDHEKAWMIRVTINQCKNVLGSSWNKKTGVLDEGIQNTLVYEQQDIPEESPLMEAIEKLPKKYRSVIHLFYYEDLSIAEMSQILNEKESTIRTWLTRARRKLKSLLKGVEL